MKINIKFYFPFCHNTFFMRKTSALESTFNICIHHFEFYTFGENHICPYVEHVNTDTIIIKNLFKNFSPVATIFVSFFKISDNAGQNNLEKTSNCVFLSRKGYISELPPSPNFNVVLEVFVCECDTTSTLILGEGERIKWGF